MTFGGMIAEFIRDVRESLLIQLSIDVLVILFLVCVVLLAMLAVTYLLRRFFAHHPFVDRAHRVLAYVITMIGVAVLLIGGLLGFVLPIVPGILLLFFAILLLRKYHKNQWVEGKFFALAHQLRIRIRRRRRKIDQRLRQRRANDARRR